MWAPEKHTEWDETILSLYGPRIWQISFHLSSPQQKDILAFRFENLLLVEAWWHVFVPIRACYKEVAAGIRTVTENAEVECVAIHHLHAKIAINVAWK